MLKSQHLESGKKEDDEFDTRFDYIIRSCSENDGRN